MNDVQIILEKLNGDNLTLAEIERINIERRLMLFDGNKHAVAASLGISIKTVYNKLKEYARDEKVQAVKEAIFVAER